MKSLQTISLFVASLILSLLAAGCSDDDENANEPIVIERPETPTQDEMKVTSSLKTYIFPSNYTEAVLAVVNRMTNQATTLDATVKAVILPGNITGTLNEAQYEMLFTIFAGGGALMVSTPTVSEWNTFANGLVSAYDRMIESMLDEDEENDRFPDTVSGTVQSVISTIRAGLSGDSKTLYIYDGDEDHPAEHFCDLVGIREHSTYWLDDLNDVDDIPPAGLDAINGGWLLTPYEYGQYADRLVARLNAQPEQPVAMTRGTTEDDALQSLMTAQTKVFDFAVQTDEIFSSVASGTATYDVWTAYSFDNQTEYYMVHQVITSRNSALNCGPTDEDNWFVEERGWNTREKDGIEKDIVKWSAYGGYMKEIETTNKLDGANLDVNTLQLVDAKPQTTIGESEVTTGMDINIDGDVGGSKEGLDAGLSGGVSFRKDYSTTTEDLEVTQNTVGGSGAESRFPVWSYEGQSPRKTIQKLIHEFHTAVANIQRNDCTVNNSWTWTIKNPSGTYTLNSDVNVITEVMACRNRNKILGLSDPVFFSSQYSGDSSLGLDAYDYNAQSYSIAFVAPCRYIHKYEMDYSSSDGLDVDTYLKDRYPEYWKVPISIYSHTDNGASGCKAFFAAFKKKLKSDLEFWQDKGYADTYIFKIKEIGTSKVIASFAFHVPTDEE
jgi:hypothetical protein